MFREEDVRNEMLFILHKLNDFMVVVTQLVIYVLFCLLLMTKNIEILNFLNLKFLGQKTF